MKKISNSVYFKKSSILLILLLLTFVVLTLSDYFFYGNEQQIRNAIVRNCNLYDELRHGALLNCFECDELSDNVELNSVIGSWQNGFQRANSVQIEIVPIDGNICAFEFRTGVCTQKTVFQRQGHFDQQNNLIVLDTPMSFYPDFTPFKHIHVLNYQNNVVLLPHLSMYRMDQHHQKCSLETNYLFNKHNIPKVVPPAQNEESSDQN